ncbi:MAG: hypothetical protein JW726_05375 [Anaerolineales bacterium]|nr:hypothetical protein [Anaerolineales bacterium]
MSRKLPPPLLVSLLSIFILATSLGNPAQAQQQSDIILTAEAGFDGLCKDGAWIPVRVTVENNGPNLEATLQIVTSNSSGTQNTYTYPINLPSQSRKEATLFIFPEGYQDTISVELISDEEVIAQQAPRLKCLDAAELLLGVISGSPSAFNVLVELETLSGGASVAQLETSDLPDQSLALEALDVLILSDIDTGSLSQSQRQALQTWVAGGGQLLVTGGPGWQKTSAGLGDLIPLIPNNTISIPSLQALAAFSQSAEELVETEADILIAAGALTPDAQVLAWQEATPLIAHRQVGLGDVYYLAADPALEPLRNWTGIADLYARLLSWQADAPAWKDGFRNWTSAEEAATSLPGLDIGYVLLICCFLGIYVIALGPVNYLALRILKRRELAWVSIPVLVLFFSGLSFLVGGLTRGRQPVINQVSVVQVWPGNPLARVDSMVGIYAPRRAAYQVELQGDMLIHPVPNSSFTTQRSITVVQSPNQVSVPDLRIEVGTTRALAVEGIIPAPDFSSDLRLEINALGVFLRGSIANNSSITLEGAVLLYPGGKIDVGSFPPGVTYPVDIPLVQAQLAGYTTSGSPYTTSTIYPGGMTSSYGYSSNDTTISDITGNSYYYDDATSYRRYQLLNGLMGNYSGSAGRGGGVYLSGWTNQTPLDLNLTGRASRSNNDTLYLIAFKPTLQTSGMVLSLTPGIFVWRPAVDSSGYYQTIYGGSIYSGEQYHYEFLLGTPIPYRVIHSLTLNIEQPTYESKDIADLDVFLWDYELADWVKMPLENWGAQNIPYPERYVGPGSAIHIRLSNTSAVQQYFSISRLDFTLEVEP